MRSLFFITSSHIIKNELIQLVRFTHQIKLIELKHVSIFRVFLFISFRFRSEMNKLAIEEICSISADRANFRWIARALTSTWKPLSISLSLLLRLFFFHFTSYWGLLISDVEVFCSFFIASWNRFCLNLYLVLVLNHWSHLKTHHESHSKTHH